jgi:hypothetical protein
MKKHEVHHAKGDAHKGEDSFLLDQSMDASKKGDNNEEQL